MCTSAQAAASGMPLCISWFLLPKLKALPSKELGIRHLSYQVGLDLLASCVGTVQEGVLIGAPCSQELDQQGANARSCDYKPQASGPAVAGSSVGNSGLSLPPCPLLGIKSPSIPLKLDFLNAAHRVTQSDSVHQHLPGNPRPFQQPGTPDGAIPRCAYWDTGNARWATDGVALVAGAWLLQPTSISMNSCVSSVRYFNLRGAFVRGGSWPYRELP